MCLKPSGLLKEDCFLGKLDFLKDVWAPNFETQSPLLSSDLYLEVIVKSVGVANLCQVHADLSGCSIFELIRGFACVCIYILYIYIYITIRLYIRVCGPRLCELSLPVYGFPLSLLKPTISVNLLHF